MKVPTKRKRSSAERLKSAGSGMYIGFAMSATALAVNEPSSCCSTSQSLEVSAVVVKA